VIIVALIIVFIIALIVLKKKSVLIQAEPQHLKPAQAEPTFVVDIPNEYNLPSFSPPYNSGVFRSDIRGGGRYRSYRRR